MRIILTSEAVKVMDKLVSHLGISPKESTIAFIPTAADPYSDKSWMEEDRDKLKQLGFNVLNFDLKNKAEKEIEDFLSKVNVIFVAGGNTFYLLEKIRQCGFGNVLERLSEKDILYIGSSAGSVIVGPNIEPITYLDDPTQAQSLKDYRGLSLVDFIVLPHYDEPKYKNNYKELVEKYRNTYKLYPLNNDQAIILDGEKLELINAK